MYKNVSTNLNFVDREKETEKFWDDNHIFEKSMENIYYVSYCMFFFNTYTDDNKCGSWDIDKIKLLFTFIYYINSRIYSSINSS